MSQSMAPQPIPPQRTYKVKSIFSNFFVVEDGVISFSLKDITYIGCILISAVILIELFLACHYGYFECSRSYLPMISDVIRLPYFDRVFCISATFFTMTVFQSDVRAFNKIIYGLASSCESDFMVILGIIATFALPGIGFFDD